MREPLRFRNDGSVRENTGRGLADVRRGRP